MTENMLTSLDHLSAIVQELEGSVGTTDAPALVDVLVDLVNLAKSLSADGAAYRALLPSEQIVEDIAELGEMAAEMSLDYMAAWARVQTWLESVREEQP